MKMEITLTREDMIDWKKNTPINEITLLDSFKKDVITQEEIQRAHIIIFKDGNEFIKLKSKL
jgi:hypothetical protein